MKRFKLFVIFLFATSLLNAQITERDIRQSRNAFSEGVRKGVEHDFAAADELFSRAILLDSLYSEAYLYRGLARLELELFEEALDDFRRIVNLDREMAYQANYFSGIALFALDRYLEALNHFNEAVRLNPEFSSFFHRGKAYFYLERYEQALKDFEISNRLDPHFPEVLYYRGKTYARKGLYDKALEDLTHARESFRNNPEFHYYFGSVLQQLHHAEEATMHLNIAEGAFGRPLQPIKVEEDLKEADDERNEMDAHTDTESIGEPSPSETSPKPVISELAKGFYNIDLEAVSPRGLGVQIASYATTEDLIRNATRYQKLYGHPAFIEVAEVNDRIRYRLIIGIFDTRDKALVLRGRLRDEGYLDSFIVRYP